MVERELSSYQAALAVREAERIIGGDLRETREFRVMQAAMAVGKKLGRGLLAAGFLAFCFLPTVTVLALVGLAIFLGREAVR